ncbi:MAG TPA: TIGR02757 family protein [Chitinophagaceae bacterium]|nr:TIGR02757 family protein [Chitinophagaceae bacterium]
MQLSQNYLENLKSQLDKLVEQYNNLDFIENDPISIPHLFTRKEDIEISGFLTATISWGKRPMILKNAHQMMEMLDFAPYDFVISHEESDLAKLPHFVHRTFSKEDFKYFLRSLKNIYLNHDGLESIFKTYQGDAFLHEAITQLHQIFFTLEHEKRTQKHVANPSKGSVAKRIHMFLRWMIRKDDKEVDFGIWDIAAAKLSCPLDVHSGTIARRLHLITRKNNDLKALAELDSYLRYFDSADPAKYDFALFGLGVNDGFEEWITRIGGSL